MSYTAYTSNGNLEIIINYSIRSESLPLPVTNRKEAKKFSYLVGIPGQHFLGYLWTSLPVDTPVNQCYPSKHLQCNLRINYTTNWHYKDKDFPWVSDSGSATVTGSSISLKVIVVVGMGSKGHATLKCSGCSFDIGKLDIHFNGGAR